MKNLSDDDACPVTATLKFIGGKWKGRILYFLSSGKKRFGQIAIRNPAISKKVLTQTLRELEKDGLIQRKQDKKVGPGVEYSLSELGKSLSDVLKEMAIWGKEHVLSKS